MSDELDDPSVADPYREALRAYPEDALRRVLDELAPWDRRPTVRQAPEAIQQRLSSPQFLVDQMERMGGSARAALALVELASPGAWTLNALLAALPAASVAGPIIDRLIGCGLVAYSAEAPSSGGPTEENGALDVRTCLWPHPALETLKIVPPTVPQLDICGVVEHSRSADGLEALLRLSALWQRLVESPLRRTQGGKLFKRDRERLMDDAALTSAIDDAPAHLNDPMGLWLSLASEIGLAVEDTESDRLLPAPDSFWAEHAVHLPFLLARRWLTMTGWREIATGTRESRGLPPWPALRVAVLLWLANLKAHEWAATDSLTTRLAAVFRASAAATSEPPPSLSVPGIEAALASILDGPAFILGLIRTGGEATSGRRAVQLSPLGRYVLGLGPPPEPAPAFDQCLYVQPNFDIIAYRQGLNPYLIGELGRFARWNRFGAAPELALDSETTYRALERGLTLPAILDRLGRHCARPLPPVVADAFRTWAQRRERVTYHAAATIIEFASAFERDRAVSQWPESSGPRPQAVGDRLLMVEDSGTIPFQRLRLLGARDYRQAPEACVEVEPDGVSLTLDPNRSDLFVAAELSRFADEEPESREEPRSSGLRRRFRVTSASLARWIEGGLGPVELSTWFERRTSGRLPASVALMLEVSRREPLALAIERVVVLRVDSAEWLDGLLQHPATAGLFQDRLGPLTAILRESALPELRRALVTLGLKSTALESHDPAL